MAITKDWQFDLNGQTMNGGALLPTGSTISLTSVTGLDLPEANSTVSVRSSGHGSTVFARYHKERVLVFEGRINTSAANYAADTYTLKNTFQVQPADIQMTFQMPGIGQQQYINVRPLGVRFAVLNISTAVGWADFQGTCVAGNPRIYGVVAHQVTLNAAGSSTTLTNAGNFRAPTTIQFNGPLTNPQITNSTTGEVFGLLQTIPAGATVTVNSLDQTVYNGNISQYQTIDPANNHFIQLAGGANTLTVSASSGTGAIIVNWRDTWI